MQAHVNEVALSVVEAYKRLGPDQRFIVGVAGVPASGKSTFAYPLADRINELLGKGHTSTDIDDDLKLAHPHGVKAEQVAVCVGMDGWHYSRAELAKFPNPEEAKRRRGAAFTFDAPGFSSFVLSLTFHPFPPLIPFPTFSHSLKDPLPSPFGITPAHRIIIIEGLYAFIDVPPWDLAGKAMDLRVFIDIEREEARRRLIRRAVKEGIADTEEEAVERADKSDMVNGDYVREHLLPPTLTIMSVTDEAFAGTTGV